MTTFTEDQINTMIGRIKERYKYSSTSLAKLAAMMACIDPMLLSSFPRQPKLDSQFTEEQYRNLAIKALRELEIAEHNAKIDDKRSARKQKKKT